jgi:cytochrome c peroxidase
MQFRDIYGNAIFNDVEKAYAAMTQSIAEFEKTKFFAPFDSKYDRYLAGKYDLTDLEDLGRSLFFSNTNTNCATCLFTPIKKLPAYPLLIFFIKMKIGAKHSIRCTRGISIA